MIATDVKYFVEFEQHPYWCQLNKALTQQLTTKFYHWPAPPENDDKRDRNPLGDQAERLVQFLIYDIEQTLQRLNKLQRRYGAYSNRHNKSVSEDERRKHILAYAQELGANHQELQQDRKAFDRWFGHDAVSDRFQRQFLETERYLSFILDCIGRVAAKTLVEQCETDGFEKVWQRMALEPVIKPLLSYTGDKRVVASAFHALSKALSVMPAQLQHQSLSEASLRFIYHACLRGNQMIWVQTEALDLLRTISPESLVVALRKRLENPQVDDDLFVRRKVVQIIGEQIKVQPELAPLFLLSVVDPSPSVRQKIPDALINADITTIERYYSRLLIDDDVEQVRASALLALIKMFAREDCFNLSLNYLITSLQSEQETFTLRVGLKACNDSLVVVHHLAKPELSQTFLTRILPVIALLHQTATSLAVRRWAAQTREKLLINSDKSMQRHLVALAEFVKTIPYGKTRRMPKWLMPATEQQLGRLLSVLAQEDFGFDVERGILGCYITRGHVFGFRIWRLLHEFRHPSPDKRQAFHHTRGRLFWGKIRVPSGILSELAETKVPGEPFFIGSEQGWRGYIPLVDEVISALAVGNKATTFYHSEGVTVIQPPTNWFKRKYASIKISWAFVDYARMRNWQEDSQDPANTYLNSLAEIGINVSYRRHQEDHIEMSEDPSVQRFFPAAFPWPVSLNDTQLWQQFKDYFVSVYENSLYELVFFMLIVIVFFITRHLYLYRQVRKARDRLPLVLGGWGTRGKSGTERIKAALMNALGYSIISKTTGCEAMFIHAHPFGQLREMFLFRPYDKATIWEQHNLVCLADELNCEVFLWECMGLTPSYIYILQRQWMRDDVATITNTYPDHEDLQGPAGVNIPEVMTQFIPENSRLITSEEQMCPILEVATKELNTQFRRIGWLEAGLLAPDVLERFPYDEHPFNIALVMAMGDELGIDYDFSLKEMADRVVADIGVLKTYPIAPIRSRRVEFINGMSANERFGCLGNWTRMGLDKVRIEQDSDTWVTIVINNRADRVARSRVFASIVVKDISFDRCILIGNNLTGFMSYVKESWDEWIATVHLKSTDETPATILSRMAKRFRIPQTEALLKTRFEHMLSAQNPSLNTEDFVAVLDQPEALQTLLKQHDVTHAQEILSYVQQDRSLFAGYQNLAVKLANGVQVDDALQREFEKLLWLWLNQKIVIVEDYYASGNQVVETIVDATPPGFYNRIIGMQNIKGTGLGFVYSWQAWENCHAACQQLLSLTPAESAAGLRALAAFQDYGYVAEETVQTTVEQVKSSSIAQSEHYQAELALILSNLQRSLDKLDEAKGQSSGGGNSWLSKINTMIEDFLDAGDAVKRRKQADLIYRDLVDERISHERAALELQALNKRQKGGWLNIFK